MTARTNAWEDRRKVAATERSNSGAPTARRAVAAVAPAAVRDNLDR